mmetsp:Transcript_10790/g.17757  ORF Transcript_10790/g.17757 Transcript_10790/m.17757 type:complete len:177 (+) Transcript_10790:79-609(+)|eukprot:CAMPEP_0169111236 /NCGR_PEP_ID=MMETSP1015-20121227/26954_1 /TAXON_ID=342587 /ORGANISM="Karlodinium micrum, Strain CCMP2283" /LENGTH=176 /DNA_ID=CAMNT_0009173113 /DNA_START=79 /DNA_END=609 /DNA_ORIENTATION=+
MWGRTLEQLVFEWCCCRDPVGTRRLVFEDGVKLEDVEAEHSQALEVLREKEQAQAFTMDDDDEDGMDSMKTAKSMGMGGASSLAARHDACEKMARLHQQTLKAAMLKEAVGQATVLEQAGTSPTAKNNSECEFFHMQSEAIAGGLNSCANDVDSEANREAVAKAARGRQTTIRNLL